VGNDRDKHEIKGFCGLCIARCGTIATVENGRFTRLDPDPSHPTGAALCAKGRAAPELVYSKDRLTRPLRRTRRKGDADPGWKEISWDEALDEIAQAMQRIAAEHGPQAVAFSQSSPSTTAIADVGPFIQRLMNAFGNTEDENTVRRSVVAGAGNDAPLGLGTRALGGGRTSAQHCGQQSSISVQRKRPQNTGIRRMHFASLWKERASGPSLTVTRSA